MLNVAIFLLVYQTSCAHIQQLVPDAKSGYYWVHIKGTKAQVYCDMDNYGMNALYPLYPIVLLLLNPQLNLLATGRA